MLKTVKNKNCLLLQGPMGPFFRKLDKSLGKQGARVFRICFNGGDFIFANKVNCHHFKGTPEQWPKYIARFLKRYRIEKIFLYGDCRFYHQEASLAASRFDIDVFVFEEGYVRPHYITFEKGGVNARSSMPNDPAYYRNRRMKKAVLESDTGVTRPLEKWTLYAIAYFVSMRILSWYFPFYRHHRNDLVLQEAAYGIRNGWRKVGHRIAERGFEDRLKTDLHRKYFFMPLQTMGDMQISCHSPFADMKDFIDVVLRSFADHAPKDLSLIVKHHPLDRGRVNYNTYIQRLAKRLGRERTIFSVHDVHLPTCLEHAIGTVTVNSTVGISSLIHKTPTIVLGRSVYNIDGLTCNGMPLDRFWTKYRVPDKDLFDKFRTCLIERTQITGSFYSCFPKKLQGPS